MSLRQIGRYWHYRFSYKGHRYEGSTEETDRRRADLVEKDEYAKAKEERVNPIFRKAPTLEKFSETFLDWVDKSPKLKPKTRKYYRNGWRLVKDSPIVKLRLDRIESDTADELEIPGSASNANNMRRTLRRMLSYAKEKKILRNVPEIELFEEQGRERLIEPWMEDLLLAGASDWMRLALIIGLDQFPRPNEIAALRWDDINWSEGTVLIAKGKTARARRTLGLTDRSKAEMQARHKASRSEWIFPSDGGKSGKKSQAGHILSGSFDKAFTVLKAKINAEQARKRQPLIPADVVFYCTRHTGATMFLVHGGDIGTLMYLMGHASITTTQKYLHLADALKGAAVMNKRNAAKGLRIVKGA